MASRNASFHEGVLAEVMLSPLKLVFTLGLGIIAVLLLAWAIDWVFVFKSLAAERRSLAHHPR